MLRMMRMMTMIMAMMMVLKSPSGVTTPMAKARVAVHEARFCNASSRAKAYLWSSEPRRRRRPHRFAVGTCLSRSMEVLQHSCRVSLSPVCE